MADRKDQTSYRPIGFLIEYTYGLEMNVKKTKINGNQQETTVTQNKYYN